VPAQTRNGRFTVRVGDAKKEMMIRPTHRPSLKELGVSIQLPAYLQYPIVTQAIQDGTLTLIEGSQASIEGRISRDLASAQLRIDARAAAAQRGGLILSRSAHGATWVHLAGQVWRSGDSPWRLTIETQRTCLPCRNSWTPGTHCSGKRSARIAGSGARRRCA
jgi:hypothetical protein